MNTNLQSNYQSSQYSAKNPKPAWWLSWPVIIVALIVFWPVAIFLIWKRTTIDKKAALLSGKTIMILGGISLFGAFVVFVTSISEGFKKGNLSAIIFYLLAGAGLLALGKKVKSNAERSKKYISIIINNGVIDIDNIAAAIPTSYDTAKKDLQKMIDKGFLEGAYINETERQIILPKRHQAPSPNQANDEQQNTRMQVVTCQGCGAQNSIASGTVGECEFCGSKIEA